MEIIIFFKKKIPFYFESCLPLTCHTDFVAAISVSYYLAADPCRLTQPVSGMSIPEFNYHFASRHFLGKNKMSAAA